MLSRFSIIVAVCDNFGIGAAGSIPWRNKEDFTHFRVTSTGSGNNAVIMGRKTYESLPVGSSGSRCLPKRRNIVVTSSVIAGVETATSLHDALKLSTTCTKVFVIGGQQLYEEALQKYNYLCDDVFVSRIPGEYPCDVFFPYKLAVTHSVAIGTVAKETFQLEIIRIRKVHPEMQYLNLLDKVLREGDQRVDRTKVGTKSLFAQRMEFDLREGFPLLTTKRTWFEGIKRELLFFISGKTDTKILEAQNVNIWKANTSAEYLTQYKLPWHEGDMGPLYPMQWRHAGAKYTGCDADYTGIGVDQLQNVITGIKNDPFGRRHIVSSWDAANIHLMALPPCHCFFQFYVGCEDKTNNDDDTGTISATRAPTYLDCVLYQRSADMFLGVPFNIASYALLTAMIGHLTNLIPRRFVHDLGDTHIYLNHVPQVNEQMTRTPYPFPTIRFTRQVTSIDDFRRDDIIIENYICHPTLKAEMAV